MVICNCQSGARLYEFAILGFMLGSRMNDITNVMRGALIACD